jgi:hypothetical protein
MSSVLYIHSVSPEAPADGSQVLVSYNWRTTTNRVVPDSQKHRSVLVPAHVLFDQSVREISERFRPMIHAALLEIASQRLADFCMDSSMAATTIGEQLFSTDALMLWNSERQALQQRLTADEIKAWLPASHTLAAVRTAHGAKVADALGAQLCKLAGPNHGLTPDRAGKLLATLWNAADAESMVGLRVMLRLQAIKDAPSAESVLDSLLG